VTQLEDTLAAGDLDLDHDLRERISALTPAPPVATDRSEEHSAQAPVDDDPPGASRRR
jgi:hypothetical protein